MTSFASLVRCVVPDADALVEARKALGLVQDDVASWQDGNQPTSQSLDLSLEQIGGFYETVDDNQQNSAQVARIASCYETSIGRYHSEERGAFTNTLSEFAKFDAAMTHFTALRDSPAVRVLLEVLGSSPPSIGHPKEVVVFICAR